MNNVHELASLFKTELQKYSEFVKIDDITDSEEEMGFFVHTKTTRYSISVQLPQGHNPGYIGCIASEHEPPYRGRDLEEAGFNRNGAMHIINDLFNYDRMCVNQQPKPSENLLRNAVLAAAENLACKFLWDDRRDDEDLPRGSIEQAIDEGVVTEREIVEAFIKHCEFDTISVVEHKEIVNTEVSDDDFNVEV